MSLAAALLLALQAGGPGSLAFDIRCMAMFSSMSRSANEEMRRNAQSASIYYYGRVDGRVPDAELEETIWREGRLIPPDQRQQTVLSCAAYMGERGRRLVEIGRRLGDRERGAAVH